MAERSTQARGRPYGKVALVTVLLLMGAGVFLWTYAELRAARAWANLQACLIGPPLRPGEALDDRLRGVHLAYELEAGSEPSSRSPAAIERWPHRCAEPARRLTRRARHARLQAAAARAAETLTTQSHPSDLSALWQAAGALAFRMSPEGAARAPAAIAASIDNRVKVRAAGLFERGPQRLTQPPDETLVMLSRGGCALGHRAEHAVVCDPAVQRWLPGAEGPWALHSQPTALRLWGASGAGSLQLDAGAAGALRPLSWVEQGRLFVWRPRAGGGSALTRWQPGREPLTQLSPGSLLQLAEGRLLQLRDRHLQVHPLRFDGDEVFGPALERLEVGEIIAVTRSCREGATRALLVLDRMSGRNVPAVDGYAQALPGAWLSLRDARGWTPMRSLPALATGAEVRAGHVALRCHGRGVSLGWATTRLQDAGERHRVHLLQCDRSGCTHRRVSLVVRTRAAYRSPGRPLAVIAPLVVPFEGAVAVLWHQGATLSLRLAPLDRLADASTEVLVDLSAETGVIGDYPNGYLIVRQQLAFLALWSSEEAERVYWSALSQSGDRWVISVP